MKKAHIDELCAPSLDLLKVDDSFDVLFPLHMFQFWYIFNFEFVLHVLLKIFCG